MPTISFNCLATLLYSDYQLPKDYQSLRTKKPKPALWYEELDQEFKNNNIEPIDFHPDEMREITDYQWTKICDHYKPAIQKQTFKGPQGFSLITRSGHSIPRPSHRKSDWAWHRPSTVLIKDRLTGERLIFGMDDNQYFGCHLYGQPNTVQEAFISMMPQEIRDRKPKDIDRQGDWFIVKENPPEYAYIVKEARFDLPHQNPVDEQNQHTAYGQEMTISGNRIYIKHPIIEHDQHPDLKRDGWWRAIQNNVKRSVSVDGVD